MSPGSAAIPLLKAAPEAEQLADRLDGGPWAGLEVCLMAGHVADDHAVARAVATVREAVGRAGRDVALTAEAPVAWPSGAFVRVDRLDDEAREGIERSAAFAAGIGSPVLTIHLFAPMTPEEFRAGAELDDAAVEAFLRCFSDACRARGVEPLIENVPPVLRMRTGGVFLSPVGGHWRDLLGWCARIDGLGVTLDTSHAALFANFAAAYPSLFGLTSDEELDLDRFVTELAPLTRVAHVSNAEGLLGEGLPYDTGEVELDPVVARLGVTVPYIVAEINEPDQAHSSHMKAGYREVERALGGTGASPAPAPRRLPADPFSWPAVVGRRDPVPALLELAERVGGRRVLVTGGAGSIGAALGTLLLGFRPDRLVLLDAHEPSLAADRRARGAHAAARIEHVLCDVRDRARLETEIARAQPDVVFHLAAYKHVDLAERFPEEYAATNLDGSWNVLRAAERHGVGTVVVASTDKAALAASRYGRSKRLMEELTTLAARRGGQPRLAVRLVNVLGSAGSASDLFVRQARAGIPLTVTDPSMRRYWITLAHAACLIAHGSLLAAHGAVAATAADPAEIAVGDLAQRIWTQVHGHGAPADVHLVGVRAGETMTEILVSGDERLEDERLQGAATIAVPPPPPGVGELVDRAESAPSLEERRAVWLEAMAGPAGAPV